MNFSTSFREKIDSLSEEKNTNIILAIDPSYGTKDLLDYVIQKIEDLSYYSCAIKLNFHVILPLSISDLKKITETAHDYNVQVIADLKLNDIFETNKVAIQHLAYMGFDCAIVNPFIGKTSLISITEFAHSLNLGIIALVYMSHPDAVEGYGSLIQTPSSVNEKNIPTLLYKSFYDNCLTAAVDGIVIGGNRLDIIKEFSNMGTLQLPIYSPGLITQGGNVGQALESGTKYLIIGRAIIESDSPINTIKNLQNSLLNKKP
jgi:orotidine-5'-phosphate decarboxylase